MARRSKAETITLVGLGVNLALAGLKLVAGILGHSYALIADAIESLGDMVGSIVIWSGLRYGAVPPDDDHPYGHGKAEALAAIFVCSLLLFAGVSIAIASIHEIITPHHTPAGFTLIVLVVVVVIKETMFRIARRTAKEGGHTAVETDAWHHRADAITSIAAFIGISVAIIGGPGYEPADDWAALFASVIIFVNAGLLCRAPLRELLDARPADIPERAAKIAATLEGVCAVEQSHARKAGSRYWLDMHVQVDPAMSVADAHVVSGKVKAAIKKEMPDVLGVLIHIEPYEGELADASV